MAKRGRAAHDPEAVEHEIETTRSELASTVDAIVDRVSPKQVARRGVAQLRDEAGKLVEGARGALGIDGVVRGETRRIDPASGVADDVTETEYSRVPRIPPAVLIGGAVAATAAVGAFIWWRRRR